MDKTKRWHGASVTNLLLFLVRLSRQLQSCPLLVIIFLMLSEMLLSCFFAIAQPAVNFFSWLQEQRMNVNFSVCSHSASYWYINKVQEGFCKNGQGACFLSWEKHRLLQGKLLSVGMSDSCTVHVKAQASKAPMWAWYLNDWLGTTPVTLGCFGYCRGGQVRALWHLMCSSWQSVGWVPFCIKIYFI